jgi:hypothetical protein
MRKYFVIVAILFIDCLECSPAEERQAYGLK